MRSQDLEGLRQRCAEYLQHIDVAQRGSMNIRDLLRAVLDPTPSVPDQEIEKLLTSTIRGQSQTLADRPALHILRTLDRMINRARRAEERRKK